MKILVVEDEQNVAEVLKRGLEEEDYQADLAYDGQVGLSLARSGKYDLILLDINLPIINGLTLCKKLRETDEDTPILMLTALGMSEDIVAGLDSGADDYMPKPFRFNELFARIKALTRRRKHGINELSSKSGQTEPKNIFTLADLKVDLDAREVFRAGKKIQLSAREYALLEYLAQNVGKAKSRSDIANDVWGLTFETGTNFIDVYINYLRNKIDKDFHPKLIQTAVGFGYALKLPSK